MNGFTIVDHDSNSIEGEPSPLAPAEPRPIVVGRPTPLADSQLCSPDEKIRLAACAAVRAYKGRDEFVTRVKRAHKGDRNWMPNLRTAQALLSIIDGLQANGVAVS